MKRNRFGMAAVGLALFGAAAIVMAAEKYDLGKQEYDANCALCHGLKGKGDGRYSAQLKSQVSDLTVLSRNNGGVFPVAHVYGVIDGSESVTAHGDRDMPIWGREYGRGMPMWGGVYKREAGEYYIDPELYTRARILALIEYMSRLQVK